MDIIEYTMSEDGHGIMLFPGSQGLQSCKINNYDYSGIEYKNRFSSTSWYNEISKKDYRSGHKPMPESKY